jgi:hypothetical protein
MTVMAAIRFWYFLQKKVCGDFVEADFLYNILKIKGKYGEMSLYIPYSHIYINVSFYKDR